MDELTGNKRIRLRTRVRTMVKQGNLYITLNQKIHSIPGYDDGLKKFIELIRTGGSTDHYREQLETFQSGLFDKYSNDLKEMVELGFFEEMDVPNQLSPMEREIYKRSLDYFSGFETEEMNRFRYMEKLRNFKILIVGVGGLGSWVLYKLLSIGIGSFVLVDEDKVELSNLNRAILYGASDVGQYKAVSAKKAGEDYCPETKIDYHLKKIRGSDDLYPHLEEEDVDLVINCADEPLWLIQKWVADSCVKASVPFISGTGARIGPLAIPGETSCKMCELTKFLEEKPSLLDSIQKQSELPPFHPGVMATKLGMTASLVAHEVYSYVTGLSDPNTYNHMWTINKDMTLDKMKIEKRIDCISCGEHSLKGGEQFGEKALSK